ncbi:hypothetical protein KR200_009436 [Drosophila serrata]|nr:hypothetical protein KR200_009436 [Drosophila serrata]
MSHKGQGEKPSGGPPVPPPPRRHRPAVPSTPTSGNVTPASGPPPPMVARRSVEPPTTSSRITRHVSPSTIGHVAPSPRKSTGPGSFATGKGMPDSAPLSTRRSNTSDRPSTSARIPQSSLRISQPTPSAQMATGVGTTSPRVTIQEAGTSTSREGLKMAAAKAKAIEARTNDTNTNDTNTNDTKTKVSLKQRLFGKKPTETRRPPSPTSTRRARRPPASAQNRAKAGRILYTTEEEVRDALIEFTVFIIFLILTSLVTLSVRHSYMFYFNDTMKKLFTTRDLVIAPSVTVNFEKQITVPDWWDYLIYNFLITLHGDLTLMDGRTDDNATNTGQGSSTTVPPDDLESKSLNELPDEEPPSGNRVMESSRNNPGYHWDPGVESKTNDRIKRQDEEQTPLPIGSIPVLKPTYDHHNKPHVMNRNTSVHHLEGRVFLYENLLLGPPRIRQVRVRKESCYVNDAFIRYFNSCYAAYSRSAEDKTNFQGISYRTMSFLNTMPLWTVLAFYRTGGYVVDLTYVKDENLAIITDLKNSHWLDRGSRLCLVEFNLFNDNTDIFQSIKLIAEIPPTGGVIPQAHFQTVKQHTFFTDRSMVMTVVYIFWYIMVVYYTIYEITEIRKSGFKNYIFSIMNMLDCIILLLCYLALVYNIWHSLKVHSITTKAMTDFNYISLDVLCFWNIIYVDMMAILAFLVWIKIFKFISFNKTLVQFTTTLKRCSKDLAGFSLMFGIVFLAYAQLGLLLFGTKHPDFRNFITSILTMIRMILGDFQYNLIEQANRVLGPIYFLTYILLVFFILLVRFNDWFTFFIILLIFLYQNMFLAIIMETYNTVKSEITQGSSQLGSYIYKKALSILYIIIHCGRKRRNNQERTAEVEAEAKVAEEEPEVMNKNLTATEARYFQEVPPGEDKELFRYLNNRVSLLEEILEKLITNMDEILKRVEQERSHRKK